MSTIRHANEILVLDQGNLVEIGTHQVLMEQQGKYYRLVQSQLLDENISEEQQPTLQNCLSIPMASLKLSEDDEQENQRKKFSFLKILLLNKPEWMFILGGCVTALINGGIEPAFAFILSRLVAVSLYTFLFSSIHSICFLIGLRRMSSLTTKSKY